MIDPERPEQVGPALLGLLRTKLACPALRFAEEPARVFGGNQTFVHGVRLAGAEPPWDAPLILRILRPHRAAGEVVFESAVQNALAALAPRVLWHETDPALVGGAFQLMTRVPGRALLLGDVGQDVRGLGVIRPLLAGFRETVLGPWPELLARTHARLHARAPEPVERAVEEVGMRERLRFERRIVHLEETADRLGLAGLRPALEWLRKRQPELPDRRSVLHGDLFPNQVLVRDGAVSGIIDWADATVGPGELDVGLVAAGIETIPLRIPGLRALQRRLVGRFRRAYARLRPVDERALRFAEVFRPTASLVALAAARAGQGPDPVPYDGPGGESRLVAHLAARGVAVRL